MTRRVRGAALVTALVLVGAGCSATRTPLTTDALDALSPNERSLVGDAEVWLEDESGIELAPDDELVFTRLEAGPDVTHVAFGHVVLDHPVVGSEVVVHVLADGTVQGATDSLSTSRPNGDDEPAVARAEAEESARKAVAGSEQVGETEVVWRDENGDLALSWRVSLRTNDPPAAWQVLVDAAEGDVVEVVDTGGHRAAECGAPAAPSACVFVPDPIYANGGLPVNRPDADGFLEGVPLQGLDDPASGRLVGEFVDVDSATVPVAAPPEADGTWELGVDDVGFEHTMVYYWVDHAQRQIQDLGFTDVRNGPMAIYPVVDLGAPGAFFTPDEQRIYLGANYTGGEMAEDAEVILHEYGHAVFDAQISPLQSRGLGDTAAYHESFADQFAFLVSLEHRSGDPAGYPTTCLGAWTYGSCEWQWNRDLHYPDDLVFQIHLDGNVYTSAIADVFDEILASSGLTLEDCIDSDACDEARDRMLTTVLTANGYLPPEFTFDDAARAFMSANEAVSGGAETSAIEATFAEHGYQAAAGSTNVPSVSFSIYHPVPAELEVTVDVIDPAGDPLCESTPLPPGGPTPQVENLVGRVDLAGDCAAYLPPSPEQRWVLRVANSGAQEGYLYGFAVSDGSTPYVLPEYGAIPAGAELAWAIDGSGAPAEPDGDSEGEPAGDGPVATIAITHPYTGDLSVFAGVADASGQVVCSVQALEPQPGEAGTGGIAGDIDLSSCADEYPPTADRQWFVQVADIAPVDVGTIDELTLIGPDGQTAGPDESLPVSIPDADPNGVVLTFTGA